MVSPTPTQRENTFLFAILALLALGMRVEGFHRGLWIDEYATVATISGLKPNWTVWHQNIPPFFYPLMQQWYRVSAEESWLRLFPLIFGVALPVATFLLLVPVGRGAALAAAGWVAVQPYLRIQSTELRAYPLFYAGCGVFWLAASRYSKKREGPVFVALVIGALFTLLSHTLGLVAFLAGVIVLAARRERSRRRSVALGLLVIGAALALLAWWDGNLPPRQDWVAHPTGEGLGVAAMEAFGFFQKLPLQHPTGIWLIDKIPLFLSFVVVPAVIFLFRRASKSVAASLALAGLVYLEGILIASLTFQPLLIGRFLGPAALALGLAFWVAWFEGGTRRAWAGVFIFAISMPWLAWRSFPEVNASRENFKQVESQIAADWQPGRAVLAYPGLSLLGNGVGHYYGKIPWDHLVGVDRDDDELGTRVKKIWAGRKSTERRRTYLIVRGRLPARIQENLESKFGLLRKQSFGKVRWYVLE